MNAAASGLGLIEYIAEKSGCDFLSDLHNKRYYNRIYKVMIELNPSDYQLKEWLDAFQYIIGEPCIAKNSSQAAAYLIERIMEIKENPHHK